MGLNDLIDGLGSALLDTGGCLSGAEARRLACDAYLIPMVLDSDSMPSDVGRQQRLATAALRDALTQRERFFGWRRTGTALLTPHDLLIAYWHVLHD